jgi:fluoride ion exporter CrcB/FEX
MTTMGTVTMGTVLAVAAGGAVGAPLRYLVDRLVTDRVTASAAGRAAGASGRALFPWGLLVVNVLGSLLA